MTIKAGWRHYADGAFDMAVADFTRADAAGNDVAVRQAALYGLGVIWDLRRPDQDPAHASRCYEESIRLDPHGPMAPWSLLALARQRHLAAKSDGDLQAAREAYGRVVAAFPEHPAGDEAFLYQQTAFLTGENVAEADHALKLLTRFAESRPHSPLAAGAWELIARAHEILRQPAERLQAQIRVLDTMATNPAAPRTDQAVTLWTLAMEAEFDVGDFATARQLLHRLLDECPIDQRDYGVHLALARMDAVEARLRAGASIADVRRELDPARP